MIQRVENWHVKGDGNVLETHTLVQQFPPGYDQNFIVNSICAIISQSTHALTPICAIISLPKTESCRLYLLSHIRIIFLQNVLKLEIIKC